MREITVIVVVMIVLGGVDALFYFWPFRYREVHPLLQQVFRSRVDVKKYHRTYFPHPGFVAEGVTFYRHGDTHIPPLATIAQLKVQGTWANFILHPHELYEMRLVGVHVQIPPPGTEARSTDFDQGMTETSPQKMRIDTIVADGTVLDLLQKGKSPLRFQIPELQVHDVQANHPFSFYARVAIPGPKGMVMANGSLGPFRTNEYAATPVSGTFSLVDADLARVDGISGHAAASGRYSGTVGNVAVIGKVSIPDFRAGDAHHMRLDAAYQVTVQATKGEVDIENAEVKCCGSVILASGSITGSPKKVNLSVTTKGGDVGALLDLVEQSTPSVAGRVSFEASAEFTEGPAQFLRRLHLTGKVSLEQIRFVQQGTQKEMDAFSARETEVHSADEKAGSDPATGSAVGQTRFDDGIAHLSEVRVSLPGAQAKLQGTFNLLNTNIHLTGTAKLERNLSHATTGWKAVLLKPLASFFRHKNAGAVVSIAVTGTADHPNLTQDVLHNK